jgi:hypothetical protein
MYLSEGEDLKNRPDRSCVQSAQVTINLPGSDRSTASTIQSVQPQGSDHRSDSIQHGDPPVLTLIFVSQIKLNLEAHTFIDGALEGCRLGSGQS